MIQKQFSRKNLTRIITGLTVFFFLLSGVVIFKALKISSNVVQTEEKSQGLRFDNKQAPERTLADGARDLQLQDKKENSRTNEKPQMISKTKEVAKKERVLAVFGDGIFRPGQFEINNNQQVAVEKLVPLIRASSGYRILIEGYTDNIRPSAGRRYIDNMELSFLRAKAVALIFVKNGIAMDRISVVGYGDTRPLASNETVEGRAKNRRVEVKLIQDQ